MNVKRLLLVVAVIAIGVGIFGPVGALLRSDGDEARTVGSSDAVLAGPADVQIDRGPIPEETTDEDGYAVDGIAFGFLTGVTKKDGKVRLTVQEAAFYMGRAATTINDGIPPPNGYLVVEDETMIESTFVLDEKAVLTGVNTLLNYPDAIEGQEPITPDELVKNFARSSEHVAVWLRHTDPSTNTGPVLALAEQYIP